MFKGFLGIMCMHLKAKSGPVMFFSSSVHFVNVANEWLCSGRTIVFLPLGFVFPKD